MRTERTKFASPEGTWWHGERPARDMWEELDVRDRLFVC
jgi:hypothetical protein